MNRPSHWFWVHAMSVVTSLLALLVVIELTYGAITGYGYGRGLIDFAEESTRALLGEAAGFYAWYLPIGVVGLVAGMVMIEVLIAAKYATELRCLRCGHVLKGLTEPRCPECGERI